MPPDLVAVGHVVRDLHNGGWTLGGTVTFAAVQAERLGHTSGIVTRCAADIDLPAELQNVELEVMPSDVSTTFQNIYHGSDRQQVVLQRAAELSPEDIPPAWLEVPLILLGPVCGELDLRSPLKSANALVGVSAQGWLREVAPNNTVRRIVWDGYPFWSGGDVLFVSEEDLGDHEEQVDRWLSEVPIVAVTRAGRGARIHFEGAWTKIQGFPAMEIDPTGAGDVFAAAFLVRYHESRRLDEAARFASAAAACSVEGPAIEAIASRETIEQRMARHPDIRLT